MSLFLPSEVSANLIGRFAQTRWEASAMTSIAVWTTWLVPYMCRMLMGIPIIRLFRVECGWRRLGLLR